MKTKLVLWGSNAQEEKVLIALELVAEDSTVKVYTFPEQSVTEEFNKLLLDEWRDGNAVEFPDGYSIEERPLSVSSRLLPDNLKVEREDIVVRAQTEWHFIILSAKLNEAYKSELEDLKERIAKLNKFESGVWEELKGFWAKVQTQVRDRNLFREHADTLRDMTNALFTELKQLRSKMDDEFKKTSEENRKAFMEKLSGIEEKINKGMRLQSIFDELKALQRNFRNTKFTKEHRSKVWEKLDGTFKTVKEKRFGPGANQDRSPVERLQKRYQGLLAAIEKMERSIKRDEDDLSFQKRKIERTDGQLEAQIRQAKIKMIEERIRSKKEKLGEMLSTKIELEQKMEVLQKKEAERKEKEKMQQAKKEAEKKIAEDIKQAAKASYDERSEELAKAAAALVNEQEEKTAEPEPKAEPKEESLLSAAANTLGEAFTDVVDTVKAVAEVMEEKLENAVEEIVDEVKERMKPKAEEATAPPEATDTPATPEAPTDEATVVSEASEEPVVTETPETPEVTVEPEMPEVAEKTENPEANSEEE